MIDGLTISTPQAQETNGTKATKKAANAKTSSKFEDILDHEKNVQSAMVKDKDETTARQFISDHCWETLQFFIVPDVENPFLAAEELLPEQPDEELLVENSIAVESCFSNEIDPVTIEKADVENLHEAELNATSKVTDEVKADGVFKPPVDSREMPLHTFSEEEMEDTFQEDTAIQVPGTVQTRDAGSKEVESQDPTDETSPTSQEIRVKEITDCEMNERVPFTFTKIEAHEIHHLESAQELGENPPLSKSSGENILNPKAVKEPFKPMEILDQIASRVDFSAKGDEQEVRIRLKPEFLGEVLIKVTNDHGGLRAEFYVDNIEVRQTIQVFAQDLQGHLLEKGLEFTDISVYQMSDSWHLGSEHRGFSEEHYQGNNKKAQYFRLKSIDEDGASLDYSYDIWAEDSSVDYVI